MTEDTIFRSKPASRSRAISLTKGCYVGQEIIIRVLHRGHGRVARRLVGLTFSPEASVPAAGTPIGCGQSRNRDGHEHCVVTVAVLKRPIAMGYVHRDFVEPGTPVIVLNADQAASAVVTGLPFQVTDLSHR